MPREVRPATAAPAPASVVRAIVPAVVAWALLSTVTGPVAAQDAPAIGQVVRNDAATAADAGLAHLLGRWNRNDSLSEDAVLKNESMWRSPEVVAPVMRDLASGAAERLDSVEIRLDGEHVLFRNSQDEQTRFNLDGQLHTDPNGNENQVLRAEVRAYGMRGEYAGNDLIVLNRHDAPFSVRITDLAGAAENGAETVRVEARVSVPRSSTLERVDFYRSEELVATVNDFTGIAEPGPARTIPATALIPATHASDFVRVSATLADGRTLEDATLVEGAEYQSEIDIRLVQVQVLATDRDGNPVSGLSANDFEIREDGERRRAEQLHTARDVPLVLGLAIDSSTSMEPIWPHLKYIAAHFVDRSLAPGDRAFLVDFDATVRLLQPLTGNKLLLSRRLERLIPFGGTAVNDGLLFSLLQFRNEPGRRALVVITDGNDEHSRSRREQATEFAERLGLPIYFILLDPSRLRSPYGTLASVGIARSRLRRISRHTGGRLFTIELSSYAAAWTPQVQAAFDQIGEDLRHQHVLTWYSDASSDSASIPKVRVTRRGLRLRSAVPLVGID